MREDMYKVIVERPRRGGGVQGDGRNWRNSRDRGAHLGMQRGYASRKWLNDNLAPLKRWLHKQVHRPWDAAYSELSQGIDRDVWTGLRLRGHQAAAQPPGGAGAPRRWALKGITAREHEVASTR
jgi:hypothetical protein